MSSHDHVGVVDEFNVPVPVQGEVAEDFNHSIRSLRDDDEEILVQTLPCDSQVKENTERTKSFALYVHDTGKRLRRSSDYISELARTSVLDPSLLGPKQCSAVIVNYISAGYILLPFAFSQAGYLYSLIIFGLVALQGYVTSLYILETCARAEAHNWTSSDGNLPHRYSMAIRETKYELSYLQHVFLGPKWTNFFVFITAFELYSTTWLMSSIFGQALAEQFPLTGITDDYKLWVGVFTLITVPLSCTSILDQALLQFIFLAGRMIMVVLMIGTIIVAFIHDDRAYFGDQVGAINDTPLIDFSQTITIIQTAIFSTSFQVSVPGMAGVASDKKSATSIFKHAISFAYFSNCVLAVLAAVYFGSSTNPSSNLNWSAYHSNSTGWSAFVSGYIVLFAAVDGLAVFPLLCCSLGDILLAAVFGERAPLVEGNLRIRVLFRLLASVPQSIGALFVDDLGVLVKFGGALTLISDIASPTVLFLVSGWEMKKRGLPTTTFYSSHCLSRVWLAYFILTTTALLLIGVVLDTSL